MKRRYHILCSIVVAVIITSCYTPFAGSQCRVPKISMLGLSYNSIDFADSQNGIAVGQEVLRTTNGGSTWIRIPLGIYSLSQVVMLSAYHAKARDISGRLFQTNDGGVNWQLVGHLPVFPSQFSFWDINNGLCVGNSEIYGTTNGGISWEVNYSMAGNGVVTNVTCFNPSSAIATGGIATILRTTDRGASWTALTNPTGNYLGSAAFANPQRGFIITTGYANVQLLGTTDCGNSWNVRTISCYGMNSLSCLDTNRWVGVNTTQLISTTNAGATWDVQNIEQYEWRISDVHYLRNGNIVFLERDMETLLTDRILMLSKDDCSMTVTPLVPANNSINVPLQHDIPPAASLTIEWMKPQNIVSLTSLFQCSTDSSFGTEIILEGKAPPTAGNIGRFFMPDLSGLTTYYWRIATVNIDGTASAWSNTWDFKTSGGCIRGLVFEDANRDGVNQINERGIHGTRVFLTGKNGGATSSDSAGKFSFVGLDSGLYQVSYRPVSPWQRSTSIDTFRVLLSLDSIASGLTFGQYYPWNSVSGIVFYDQNENGIKDGIESGVTDWNIRLSAYGESNTTVTDGSGLYEFPTLVAQQCSVVVLPQDGWEAFVPRLVDGYEILFNGLDRHISTAHFAVHPIPPRLKIPLSFHDKGNTGKATIRFGIRPGAGPGIWGVDPSATPADFSEGEDELPPVIPGAYDARFIRPPFTSSLFGNGSWVDMRPYVSPSQVDTYRIHFTTGEFSNGAYPVTFSWSKELVQTSYNGPVVITIGDSVVYNMKTHDSLVVSDSLITTILLIADSPVISPAGVRQTDNPLVPPEFFVDQNYPNPFNPVTNFRFQVPEYAIVTLKVFDILGREIAVLVNEMKSRGTYTVPWDAGNIPSGIYYYRLTAATETGKIFSSSRKMLLIK